MGVFTGACIKPASCHPPTRPKVWRTACRGALASYVSLTHAPANATRDATRACVRAHACMPPRRSATAHPLCRNATAVAKQSIPTTSRSQSAKCSTTARASSVSTARTGQLRACTCSACMVQDWSPATQAPAGTSGAVPACSCAALIHDLSILPLGGNWRHTCKQLAHRMALIMNEKSCACCTVQHV